VRRRLPGDEHAPADQENEQALRSIFPFFGQAFTSFSSRRITHALSLR